MTAENPPRPAPRGLATAGKKLWRRAAGAYELREDEAEALAAACRTLDELVRLEAELADAAVVVEGSKGQPVPNPLFAAVREHRRALTALLAAAGLAAAESAPLTGTQAARAMAHQRWNKGA